MWWKGTSHIERSHEWDYEINKVIAFVFPIVGSNGAWLLRDCIEWKCHCEIFADTRRTLLEWLTGWGWRTTYILFICLVREGSCGLDFVSGRKWCYQGIVIGCGSSAVAITLYYTWIAPFLGFPTFTKQKKPYRSSINYCLSDA